METYSDNMSSVSAASTQSKTNAKQLVKVVNLIFSINNRPLIRSLSQDFADGVRFLDLFNLLFGENMDLKLTTQTSVEARMANWNKINMSICFNYLQQQFILIASTMKSLAQAKKGSASKAIICLLECTKGTQAEQYLNEDALCEIAQVISFQLPAQSGNNDPNDFSMEVQQKAQEIMNSSNKVCISENDLKFSQEELEMIVARGKNYQNQDQQL